jgi:hypothetical protein
MGCIFMKSEITQPIARPGHASGQTDFPTIAFRPVVHDPALDHVARVSRVCVKPGSNETKMPKMLTSIRSLARTHTRTAVNVLVRIMRNEDATPAARVSAANAILDRGWGKATQPIGNNDDGTIELIHRIERIIVNPKIIHSENSDGPDL